MEDLQNNALKELARVTRQVSTVLRNDGVDVDLTFIMNDAVDTPITIAERLMRHDPPALSEPAMAKLKELGISGILEP